MRTVIVNIPEKKEHYFLTLMKKNRFKSRVLTDEELEDAELARWIDEGMKTEDIPIERVFELLKKNGTDS
ncbi:MAG: hypothetical protein HY738_19545 [Bacteroidia bacterium]|nr:hypothetical protein [Bacteroidia bacterium]